jgi:hypothetical protein
MVFFEFPDQILVCISHLPNAWHLTELDDIVVMQLTQEVVSLNLKLDASYPD